MGHGENLCVLVGERSERRSWQEGRNSSSGVDSVETWSANESGKSGFISVAAEITTLSAQMDPYEGVRCMEKRSELPLCAGEISVSLLPRLWANSLARDGANWASESWVQWHWPHKGLFSCLTYLQMAVYSLPALAFTIIST